MLKWEEEKNGNLVTFLKVAIIINYLFMKGVNG